MLIFPAVDIRGGRCVRLLRGDYAEETVFGEDPVRMAVRWIEQGARALHIVDLDGARDGRGANRAVVERIVADLRERDASVETQLGGGIRCLEDVEAWLATGLQRVIVGTAAVDDPALVTSASRRFRGRVWVGIDARGGKVAVDGWTRTTELDAGDFAREVEARGAGGIVFTNIERDGTGEGVDASATAELADHLRIPVVASGGVRGVEDVEALIDTGRENLYGVIVGRALYDGSVSLGELLETARRARV